MNEEKFTVKEEVLDLEDLIFPSTSQKPYCYDLNTKSETFVNSETDIKPDKNFDIKSKNQNNVSIETENLSTTEKEDSVEYNLPYEKILLICLCIHGCKIYKFLYQSSLK